MKLEQLNEGLRFGNKEIQMVKREGRNIRLGVEYEYHVDEEWLNDQGATAEPDPEERLEEFANITQGAVQSAIDLFKREERESIGFDVWETELGMLLRPFGELNEMRQEMQHDIKTIEDSGDIMNAESTVDSLLETAEAMRTIIGGSVDRIGEFYSNAEDEGTESEVEQMWSLVETKLFMQTDSFKYLKDDVMDDMDDLIANIEEMQSLVESGDEGQDEDAMSYLNSVEGYVDTTSGNSLPSLIGELATVQNRDVPQAIAAAKDQWSESYLENTERWAYGLPGNPHLHEILSLMDRDSSDDLARATDWRNPVRDAANFITNYWWEKDPDFVYSWTEEMESSQIDIYQAISEELRSNVFPSGHAGIIEEVKNDPSVTHGVETVTFPIDFNEQVEGVMPAMFDHIDEVGETSEYTGMHMNISVKGLKFKRDDFNPIKLTMLMNEDFMRDKLNQKLRDHVKSSFKQLNTERHVLNLAETLFEEGTSAFLEEFERKIERGDKYHAINFTHLHDDDDGRVEFRLPGAANYHKNLEGMQLLAYRLAYMTLAAYSPEFGRKEYLSEIIRFMDRRMKMLDMEGTFMELKDRFGTKRPFGEEPKAIKITNITVIFDQNKLAGDSEVVGVDAHLLIGNNTIGWEDFEIPYSINVKTNKIKELNDRQFINFINKNFGDDKYEFYATREDTFYSNLNSATGGAITVGEAKRILQQIELSLKKKFKISTVKIRS